MSALRTGRLGSAAAAPPIGRLRHRLVLETAATAADGTTVWSAAATVAAALEPVTLDEVGRAGHVAGRVTHRIHLRWRDGVTSACRLVKGGRVFRVLSVADPGEDRRRLLVEAEEEAR